MHLKDDTKVQVFLAIFYSNSKIFYMMTNEAQNIYCLRNKIYLWRKDQQHTETIDLHNLNIIY